MCGGLCSAEGGRMWKGLVCVLHRNEHMNGHDFSTDGGVPRCVHAKEHVGG